MILGGGNPDFYDTATLIHFWDLASSHDGSPAPVAGVRPDGIGGRPALTGIGGHAFVVKYPVFPRVHPTYETLFFNHGRWIFEAASFPASSRYILACVDPFGTYHIMATLDPSGTVSIYRGFYDELLDTSDVVLVPDTIYKLGLTVTLHPTGGTARVWRTVGDVTSVIAQATNVNTLGSVHQRWGATAFGLPEDCALNFYHYGDGYGHQPTFRPGFQSTYLEAIDNGTFQDWTPTNGTPASVVSVNPPDFVERIQAAEAGDRYSLRMSTFAGAAGRILAVQSTALARNISPAVQDYQPLTESAGVSSIDIGASSIPLSPSYDWFAFQHLMYQDPSTASEWLTAGINANRYGGACLAPA